MADAGGVDTSSYLKPQPAQNPLDQILKTGQAVDTLGQIEVGKGLQQAIQPDGTIDRNVLAQVLKGSVAGSMQAPKALNALETLRQAGYAADTEGVNSLRNQLSYSASLLSPYMKLDPNKGEGITQQEAINNWGKMIKHANEYGLHGIVPMASQSLVETKDMNPQQRLQYFQNKFLQGQQVSQVFEASLPQGEMVNTGQRQVLTPTGTKFKPAFGTRVQNEIPPTATQPNAQGQPTFRGTQPPSTGADYEPPGTSLMKAPSGTGVRPPRSQNMTDLNAQVVPPSFDDRYSAAYGVPRGGPAAPPPGFETATEAGAKTSAELASNLQRANDESQATKAIIGNLEKEAKNFTSGPLADYKRIGKSFAIANLPIPSSLKEPGAIFDPSKVADQESFNKNIYNLVQSQFKALGGTGTDAKLDSASHTSPSELMSQVGVKNILSLLKGNQDAIQAKTKAWNAWKAANGPQSYPEFTQDFNNKFDPRVFQFKYMTPAQRQEYYNKIDNPEEKRELLKRVEIAHDAGWVKY